MTGTPADAVWEVAEGIDACETAATGEVFDGIALAIDHSVVFTE